MTGLELIKIIKDLGEEKEIKYEFEDTLVDFRGASIVNYKSNSYILILLK